MPNNTVSIVFNRKGFTFTRATLEQKVKRMAKENVPTVSGLHSVILPVGGGKTLTVSPTWAATFILDTPAITVNASHTAMRGAYNPAQVLRAFSQLADLGVKVTSVSPSITYALYSKMAAQNLKTQIEKITGGGKVKPEAKPTQKRKPAKVKPMAAVEADAKPE